MSELNGVYVDSKNDIYVRCGDSGKITITGLPTDGNYKVVLGVYNPLTKEIVAEAIEHSSNEESIELAIGSSMTETIGVGHYFYAIKLILNSDEQTVLPKASVDESGVIQLPIAPSFFVSPKMAEGNE
jgi:hypothetical protein